MNKMLSDEVTRLKYQIVSDQSGRLVATTENGERWIADKIEFIIRPKENNRREILAGVQKKIADEAQINETGLLKYYDFFRDEDDNYYLIRPESELDGQAYAPAGPEDACRGLLRILRIMKAFHQHGRIIGGLSRGMLWQDAAGELVLQDPLVMNYLSSWLGGSDYRYDLPPEVIRGEAWTTAADVYSWGVIAYQLLTGDHPFTARNDADRVAQVLRGKVIEPRTLQPYLSPELSALIVKALSLDPESRPGLEKLWTEFSQLLDNGRCVVSAEEAKAYSVKAGQSLKRHQSREKVWLWFRRYGAVCLAAVAVLLVGIFLTLEFRADPVITKEHTPAQVVDFYFEAVRTSNVPLLIETLHKAKNSLESMVSNVHVMSVQTATAVTPEKRLRIVIDELRIKPIVETPDEYQYEVVYKLHVNMGKKTQYMEREDRFSLRPVRKIWRITDIDVLKSNVYEVENTEETPQDAS